MKISLEISGPLLRKAKKYAAQKGLSLSSVIQSALRAMLESRAPRFTLKKATFKGNGLHEGIQEENWEAIRTKIYKGRGT